MGKRDFQDQKLDSYLEAMTSAEPPLLRDLRLQTKENFQQHHMISGHVQGRFLSLLSKIQSPENILEIGTFTGYATLCLAEGLSDKGKITTIDVDSRMATFYQSYFDRSPYVSKIKPVIADALDYLEHNHEFYDLVFLDANKKQYINYFELLVPKLCEGGVILADNTLWKGKVLEPIDPKDKMTKALDEFNKHIVEDDRVEVILLPLRDGITIIRKK